MLFKVSFHCKMVLAKNVDGSEIKDPRLTNYQKFEFESTLIYLYNIYTVDMLIQYTYINIMCLKYHKHGSYQNMQDILKPITGIQRHPHLFLVSSYFRGPIFQLWSLVWNPFLLSKSQCVAMTG